MANTAQLKMLNWGDDLRLPTFVEPTEFLPIIDQLEEYRAPSIPFQSKHLPSLKRNVWFALKRPEDRSRAGLLCLWPLKKACIFVLGKRVALLHLRVDSQLLGDGVGLSLFVATLSPTSRRLWVEDTLVWKGRHLDHESFTTRWGIAKQLVDSYILPDSQRIGGIEIETGKWGALSSMQPDGSWDLIADDSRSRFFWKAHAKHFAETTPAPAPEPAPKPAPEKQTNTTVAVPELSSPMKTALVVSAKRESGPDQWSLTTSDGVSLGRALIRKMTISSAMNGSGTHIYAEVSWNADFKKWEILSVHSGPASPYSFFSIHK